MPTRKPISRIRILSPGSDLKGLSKDGRAAPAPTAGTDRKSALGHERPVEPAAGPAMSASHPKATVGHENAIYRNGPQGDIAQPKI